MNTRSQPGFAVAVAAAGLASLLGAGCIADDLITDDSEEILAGTLVPNADNSGLVSIGNPSQLAICSGTLLANDWVLTAEHCNVDVEHPENIVVFQGNWSESWWKDGVYSRGAFAVNHPSLDFALVRLERALPVNGRRDGYRMGFFTLPGTQLMSKPFLHAMGYGNSVCSDVHSCSQRGLLREAYLAPTGQPGPHTFSVSRNDGGQVTATGDSGSALFLDSAAGRVIAGVLKSGNLKTSNYGLPENVRNWALSYLYDLPVALPTVWNAHDTSDERFLPSPLPNSYVNQWAWEPCPGGSYRLEATADLLAGDVITVATEVDGETTYHRLTGKETVAAAGEGFLTVQVVTNAGGKSRGLVAMPIQCDLGIAFAEPWAKPLAGGTSESVDWNPCPGGGSFRWEARYDFAGDDHGTVTSRGRTVKLRGSGVATGSATDGATIGYVTGGGASRGFSGLRAYCDAAIVCHETQCMTTPAVLENDQRARTRFTPCAGRDYSWRAKVSFPDTNDSLTVSSADGTRTQLTGVTHSPWQRTRGTLDLDLTTDSTGRGRGLEELTVMCADWSTPTVAAAPSPAP